MIWKATSILSAIGFSMLAACTESNQSNSQMDAIAQAGVDNGFPAYVVGVSAPGRHFTVSAVGIADISAERAVEIDDGFHIASITKAFTTVAILKLIDEGTIGFDDRLPDLLPAALIENIPHSDRMTVRQLLTHRTGLYSPNNDPEYWRPLIGPDADKAFYWSSAEIVAFAHAHRNDPLFEPGADQQYGDINSVLLSLIAEQASGMAFKDYIRSIIFDPLEMSRTYFLSDLAKNEATPFPRARAYTVVSDILTDAFQFSDTFPQTRDGLADTTEGQERSDGAAGIISTAPDLHLFFRALFDGALLSENSTQFILSVADDVNAEKPEALGALRAYYTSHGIIVAAEGDGPGANAVVAYRPADGALALAFTNLFGRFDENEFMLETTMPALLDSIAEDRTEN